MLHSMVLYENLLVGLRKTSKELVMLADLQDLGPLEVVITAPNGSTLF